MSKDTKTELHEGIGARLRQIRTERGLTQAQVAELAGVDPQTYQRAETGRTGLSTWRLHLIATRGLGVRLAALFEDVEENVPEPATDPAEVQLLHAWRQVPPSKRDLAMGLLRQVIKDG